MLGWGAGVGHNDLATCIQSVATPPLGIIVGKSGFALTGYEGQYDAQVPRQSLQGTPGPQETTGLQ